MGLLAVTVAPPSASAFSPPSQSCSKYPSNPVLNDSGEYPSDFSNTTLTNYATHYDYASVLKVGGTYEMWFSGAVDNVSGIFAASSSDGVAWSVRSAPVLTTGANGTWDSSSVYSPDVISNGSTYLMYYTGTGNGPNQFRQVGLATSSDMIHWQKYQGNPIIVHGPGTYDSFYTRYATVLYDPPIYRMWYTGQSLLNSSKVPSFYIAVDYATSTDGVHWVKSDANPVYGGGANWGSYFFEHPSVVKVNGTLIMAGDNGYQIAYVTSQDGIRWGGGGQVLVGPSADGWDNGSVLYPTLLVQGLSVIIWYTGERQTPHEGYFDGIGLVSCPLVIAQATTTSTVTGPTTTVTSTQTVSYYPPTTPITSSVPTWAYALMAVFLVVGLAAGYLIKRPTTGTRANAHASSV